MTIGEEPIPDVIEPITAYRMWLADADGRLSSFNREAVWIPATWMGAQCSLRPHAAPAEGCTCGFYAGKQLDDVLGIAAWSLLHVWRRSLSDPRPIEPIARPRSRRGVPILGKALLAGTVIEHDAGYRAALARPVEILPLPGFEECTDAVSRRYGLPVGEPIALEAVQVHIDGRRNFRCGTSTILDQLPRQPPPPPSHWPAAISLFYSALFLATSIWTNLKDPGPEPAWWRWFVACACAAAVAISFRTLRRRMRGLIRGQPGVPAEPLDGRPPLRPDLPRPY